MNRMLSIGSCLLGMLGGMTVSPSLARGESVDFAREIQPIFAKACHSCHSDASTKGGLRLDAKAAAFAGGNSGPVIGPGKPDSSELLARIAGTSDGDRMPPKGAALSAAEIAKVRAWIADGANWPDDGKSAAATWWSLKPLVKPALPKQPGVNQPANPIDAFIQAKLAEQQLTPSPSADRRTLIRRLSFDLIGLPPTPQEIAEFVADSRPDAVERLVDRLLASPAYGERWARHWLDVVHFGETHGYDKDKPRPNAWPYRDYVIRSLNADKPYAQFIQEQVAGDVLFPGTRDGIEALGFIAAGPWDFIGHAEVPESKIDGKIARHLDRDDMVANTMSTFVSMTVHCAQCHNHKFDPIPTEDYYRLQAVFAAVDRTDRAYDADPQIAAKRRQLQQQLTRHQNEQRMLQERIAKLGGPELDKLQAEIAAAQSPQLASKPPQHGYHSAIEPSADRRKWVQVDLGESTAIREIVVTACHDDFNNIGAGFGFPVRFQIAVSDDARFADGGRVIVDRTQADVPNPKLVPMRLPVQSQGRFVRITITKLAPRQNDFIAALAELEVRDGTGTNRARGKPVTALDSIEAPIRWAKANLTDGIAWSDTRRSASEITQLQQRLESLRLAKIPAEIRAREAELTRQLAQTEAEIAALPAQQIAYIGAVHTGGGAFVGTGGNGGKPREIRVLPRGDVTKPAQVVEPGALRAITALPGVFPETTHGPEGARRAALARWLSAPENPLTWRSIVNRVWLYHFGRGIVETPNDFGRMGGIPSHPELLDWLAADFRDSGGSLKRLHRQIVLSDAYQQSSENRPDAARNDAGNVYLWRQNRRKLEAEAIRDAVLAISGKLDRRMGGPSFQDFGIEKPEHSPHYEYDKANPDDPQLHRRSVYRFLVRSKQQPFMASLDCADPSLSVERRNQSQSPLQALAMLNNRLMLAMARHFGDRLEREAGPNPAAKATLAMQLAVGRAPSDAERAALVADAAQFGWAHTCRVLMNLNEFVFAD
ncbi:DUF1553 domain-containing protein [Tuwongella immobilis]|uniref:Cytochrome c domain-containing protein n=1 Tax=Tuwongella immobilis TaxID=692036 RepID=A0A6C2YKJ8_9BACT|nr:DUF1553 domain-containing protein [Tuwongella immobilis]VIP01635.1 cytochrome c : Uncharacterized protein OS=Pirellula staleyi (strain ATCC 27377 / DSM 6068 / ICPB 4128) GN=Psta_2203 PE=4 SV=1: PSCyt1: PSCyt2: F5_F8_type_C: PSD1 [Tuwongella immobilis]VTR98993.1 cytochrome c : Uncharacterized protein OS=Pirellula staleyi (strain ATCC 27377 / DSM 6068 / ICPB 4128) GN=Psta_2203 PE=4 SV=1: PSCyt1: PSCyt2: F5_F8_type_C: PSD1 [Tuwongella immobilis]